MPQLTQARLKELLHYNPCNGMFTWIRSRRGRIKPNKQAGGINHNGYITISLDCKRYYAHRLVWLYMNGTFPNHQIDHINHQRTDNRMCNLRDATCQQNQMNASISKNNTSGIIGVSWCKRYEKWKAHITHDGKAHTLGYFSDKDMAVEARKKAETKHGFHKNHGAL